METAAGKAPRVESKLTLRDRLGGWKVRWDIGRMNYKVDPGLYALGHPDADSPVFISANFKMSFDHLRTSLNDGRSGWILVLDTDGINVWCAAGKGTFGTEELANRIESSGLAGVVKHRTVIVPQLGAPGVSAREVQKRSGFKVVYGPVRAADLPDFLDAGMKAAPGMRIKTFETGERMSLVPVEIVHAVKNLVWVLPFVILLSGFSGRGAFLSHALQFGSVSVIGLLTAIAAGCVITPMLLPWLPGRAFSLKGVWPGIVCAALFLFVRDVLWGLHPAGALETFAWVLVIPAVSAYLAMNFTGCSTFTSLSGVKKEMKWAVPAQIAAVGLGAVLWVTSIFV
ncbi:MAG: mercury methylation corrinoid protein HgcA [Deltaproteobacteria bacterium]|nr:mercury methylation corrinoid protein HgcA [Deltaproteobacteria bacterium]